MLHARDTERSPSNSVMHRLETKGMKCVCGKTAKYNERLKFVTYPVGGWVCRSCGETYFHSEKAERILRLNKIRKMRYQIKLNQVKNNLTVRILKEVSDALWLRKGENLELVLGEKSLILHLQPKYPMR